MQRLLSGLLLTVTLTLATTTAFADDTCKSRAADKKLAGAALASFTKKCEKDAKVSCDQQAADKKIYGAAKASFTKKCVSDAAGS